MGYLTTHVLDTAAGKPGDGISLQLFRLGDDRQQIFGGVTNADGRTDAALLDGDELLTGAYELEFDIGEYFLQRGVGVADPPFLGTVVIRFAVSAGENYHVPLLASPWSYSTYRGS